MLTVIVRHGVVVGERARRANTCLSDEISGTRCDAVAVTT